MNHTNITNFSSESLSPSSDKAKSKISRFSLILIGFADFTTGTIPLCTSHLKIICATDF